MLLSSLLLAMAAKIGFGQNDYQSLSDCLNIEYLAEIPQLAV
jgi:hypothetical protein